MHKTNQRLFDVRHFIAKFSIIPEKQWICGQLGDADTGYCAFGFCGGYDTMEAKALAKIFSRLNLNSVRGVDAVVNVNDGYYVNRFQQPTPKLRILAALKEVRRMEIREAAKSQIQISNPPITGEELIAQLEGGILQPAL